MWLWLLVPTTLMVLVAGLRRVREGEVARLNRFGRPAGVLSPGVHWLLPGEAIATRVSLLGRHLELSPRRVHAGAHTARVGGRIYFQVLDAERALAEPRGLGPGRGGGGRQEVRAAPQPWGSHEHGNDGKNDGIFKMKLEDFTKLYQGVDIGN